MKIAIFGMGSIGKRHAHNLIDMGGHDLAAYDQAIPGRSIYSYKSSGVTMMSGTPELLGWKPDAVLICTPPAIHAGLINECMHRSGCYVLCEKPLANFDPSAMPCDDLRHFGWRGDKLFVGYQLRFCLKEFADNAQCSHVRWVHGQDMSSWPSAYQKDVLEEFSHEIDAACFVNGPAESVVGFKSSTGAWNIELRHIRGSSTIYLDPHTPGYVREAHAEWPRGGGSCNWFFNQEANDLAYKKELEAFLDVCKGGPGTDFLCSGVEAAHVCKIIEACRVSARDCSVVRL